MNTHKKIIQRAAVVLMAASLFSSAFAESSTALSRGDKKFFENAAKSGMKEVVVSQDVLSKLTVPEVREFAQMMVDHHTSANSQLTDLASRKGFALPTLDSKVDRKWSDKTKDVDYDYIKAMVDDHEEAVELFEKAAKSDDPEIAAFATKTLPTLQQHLAKAKELKARVK